MICWGTGEAVKILLLKPGTVTSREMIWIYRIEQESRVWILDRQWEMFILPTTWFASLKLNQRCESFVFMQSSSIFWRGHFAHLSHILLSLLTTKFGTRFIMSIDHCSLAVPSGRKAGIERKSHIHCCASSISYCSRRTYRSHTCTLLKEKRWRCLFPSIPLTMWRTGCWKLRNPWRPVYGTT